MQIVREALVVAAISLALGMLGLVTVADLIDERADDDLPRWPKRGRRGRRGALGVTYFALVFITFGTLLIGT